MGPKTRLMNPELLATIFDPQIFRKLNFSPSVAQNISQRFYNVYLLYKREYQEYEKKQKQKENTPPLLSEEKEVSEAHSPVIKTTGDVPLGGASRQTYID
ncbi:hypothetical protein JCM33374_g6105 [Metschnikowia sp. JCM 33374]|nr:hypothetical protein JCM33374_g6105 [Metschnikowia sp. JCM 33374]